MIGYNCHPISAVSNADGVAARPMPRQSTSTAALRRSPSKPQMIRRRYSLTNSVARDAGRDISEGVEKSAKVTIYYTEEADYKVAHFFQRAL